MNPADRQPSNVTVLPWTYQQQPIVWVVSVVQGFVGGLLAFLTAEDFGAGAVLAWVAALWAALALHLVMSLRGSDAPSRATVGMAGVAGVFMVCAMWGFSSLLLLGHHEVDLFTLTHLYVLAGVAAAAASLYAPCRRAALVGVLATLMPLSAVHLAIGGIVHYAIAAGTLLYIVALLVMSNHFGRLAVRAMQTRQENEDLARRLADEARRRSDEAERAAHREQEQEAEQHARYGHLFANFRDPIMLLDVVDNEFLRIGSLNPAAQELLGITEGEARGQPLESCIPEPLVERLIAAVIECMRTGGASRYEAELPTSGQPRRFEVTVIGMRDRAGEVNRIAVIGNDVTERKRADAELRRSRDFLQAVIDGISDAVLVKDRAHRWLLMNRALCQWLGRPREELIGQSDYDYMPKEQADLYWRMDDLVLTELEEHVNEEPVTGADGVTRHVQAKKRRVTGPDGETLLVGVIRDISERRRMEEMLAARENELRTLVDNMPDPVVRYDRECRRVFVTPGIRHSTDRPAGELLGKRPVEAWTNGSVGADEYEQRLRAVMESGRADEVLLQFLLPGGREHWDQIRLVPEFDEAGEVTSVLAVARDVTELRRAEALLHVREEAFRSLAENSPDTIVRYDRDQRRLYVNPAFVALAGMPADALLGRTPSQLTGEEMSARYLNAIEEVFRTGHEAGIELNWHTPDGAPRCTHVRIVPEHNRDGEIATVLAIGRDISEIDDYRRRILNLAFYDPMTGLANRALFNDRLQQLVNQGGHHITGLILIDLDGFKTINDSLGHAAGDELLRAAGRRLVGAVRGYDTVARLGGDEFAVLLPELHTAADAGGVAHNLLAAFAEPFEVWGRELFVTASMGIALFPLDGTTAEEMLKYADSAMYHAKSRGRNTFQFYRAEMTRRAEERLQVEARLRKALSNGELSLEFQPQVALADRRLYGAEALLRWNNPVLGHVSPDRFITIAEDTGLIVEIGEWVLSEAARTAAEWNRMGHPLRVAVNLSTRQFRIHGFVDSVLGCLERAGCKPEWIELEITESLLLEHNAEVVTTMKALRSYGLSFAVDDFGTGYSALGYLQRFPIDAIKIDRSFVQGITNNPQAEGLVRAIVAMTEVLKLELVAEGVETEAQCERLLAWGADVHAQGYLFDRPMPRAEFERRMFAPDTRRVTPARAG